MCLLPAPLRQQAAPLSRHGDHQFLSPCAGAMLRLQTDAVRGLVGSNAGFGDEILGVWPSP